MTEDEAWKIGVQILRRESAGTIEEHRDEHMMLTTCAVAFAGNGGGIDFIGVWVEPAGAGNARVRFVAKSRYGVATCGLDEELFHRRFCQAVSSLQSGKPVPSEAPRLPPRLGSRCESGSDCERDVCIEGLAERDGGGSMRTWLHGNVFVGSTVLPIKRLTRCFVKQAQRGSRRI